MELLMYTSDLYVNVINKIANIVHRLKSVEKLFYFVSAVTEKFYPVNFIIRPKVNGSGPDTVPVSDTYGHLTYIYSYEILWVLRQVSQTPAVHGENFMTIFTILSLIIYYNFLRALWVFLSHLSLILLFYMVIIINYCW